MADIQAAVAQIRQGKKLQHENIMVCPIPYGDHKNVIISQKLNCSQMIITTLTAN